MVKEIIIIAKDSDGEIIQKKNRIDYLDLITEVTIYFQKYIKNAEQKKIDKFIDELLINGQAKCISENNRRKIEATAIKM